MPGSTETITLVSTSRGAAFSSALTITSVGPAFSETRDCIADSFTIVEGASLSRMVTVASCTVRSAFVPRTRTVSASSTASSSRGDRRKVWVAFASRSRMVSTKL